MAISKKYQIDVTAIPQYVSEQSDPESERYIFAYTITIENVGTVTAQLISRHWIITDGNSNVQEVRGLGVIDMLTGALDPMNTDVGRLRAHQTLPERVRAPKAPR